MVEQCVKPPPPLLSNSFSWLTGEAHPLHAAIDLVWGDDEDGKDLNWSLNLSLFFLYTTYSGIVQIYSSVQHSRCLQGKIVWQSDTISRIIASCLSRRQLGFIFLLTGYLKVLRSLKKKINQFQQRDEKSLFSLLKSSEFSLACNRW